MAIYKLKDAPSDTVKLPEHESQRDDEPTAVTKLLDDMRESLHTAEEATSNALEKGEEVRRAARRKGSSPSLRLLISKARSSSPPSAGTPDGT